MGWTIWVDTGGTFTDCVALRDDGLIRRAKVLSSSRLRIGAGATGAVRVDDALPESLLKTLSLAFPGLDGRWPIRGVVDGEIVVDTELPRHRPALAELISDEEAPIFAARLAIQRPAPAPLDDVTFRLGTTMGTNALLERRHTPPAFFVTAGFKDLLRIGDQRRPDLFALHIVKPEPLHGEVIEVDERMDATGRVITPMDEDGVRTRAQELAAAGVRNAAVALVHAWTNASHERRIGELLLEAGFEHVVLASEVAPTLGLLARAQTAVVSAALRPKVARYLHRVASPLSASSQLHVMTSAGGLSRAASFDPTDGLLSGPAGGVVGAAEAARRAGRSRVISFDMGGTSTDVARIDLDAGGAEIDDRHQVGDATILAPALAIRTVAAGGGSICGYEHDELHVGPASAGADPGPACYGAGGPLTITDVNLLLGRLDASTFVLPVDVDAAERAIESLLARIEARTGDRPAREAILEGLLELANQKMAGAIERVSAQRGYDPADHALVAFGGAAGQHACGVAARLGMRQVIVPPDASLLSAVGIGASSMTRFAHEVIMRDLRDVDVPGTLERLADEAMSRLRADGADDVRIARRELTMRPKGQEFGVEVDPGDDPAGAFQAAYARLFGHAPPDGPIEVVSARVMASERSEPRQITLDTDGAQREPRRVSCIFQGRRQDATVIDRASLHGPVCGPALIVEAHTATVVEPGWNASINDAGAIVLDLVEQTSAPTSTGLIATELMITRITDIAARMGETVRRTSVSPNVKERLDYSCAVLDATGHVVASAPHVPVHLGAMGLCVRRVREAIDMHDGDVVITNHPGFGGSHLPDVTTITPVHHDGRLVAHVATRAHHAEIGGVRPGSMSPTARTLAEEGVCIAPTHIVHAGHWDEPALTELFAKGPHPSRTPHENIADIRASVAANEQGRSAILGLIDDMGAPGVGEAMQARIDRSERLVRDAIGRLGDLDATATQQLDDDTPIKVRIRRDGDSLSIDLRGSGRVHPHAMNAPLAVTRSAIMYALRLLIEEPVPLNDGLLLPIDLITEPGLLAPPFSPDPEHCPAVAAGNVETSQRLVDTLLLALGLGACSQGTMNNLAFGTTRFGFYETICGGAGAGPDFDGADGVHTHMTNTAITDVEVVERRVPVRVRRFELRRGSGGRGRHTGGDGVVREIEFLADAEVSLLTQHRVQSPYGIRGGEPGARGSQHLTRPDGTVVTLAGIDALEVCTGDRLTILTPGGGGWGTPD